MSKIDRHSPQSFFSCRPSFSQQKDSMMLETGVDRVPPSSGSYFASTVSSAARDANVRVATAVPDDAADLLAEANAISVDQRLLNDRKRILYRKARERNFDQMELKVRIYGEGAREWTKSKKGFWDGPQN